MDDNYLDNELLPQLLATWLDELAAEGVDDPQDHYPESELPGLCQVHGFLTKEWFGPFLLGPRHLIVRGRC